MRRILGGGNSNGGNNNGGNESGSHTHTMNYYAYVEATETEDGHEAYYYCSGCGKYFYDANGNDEVTNLSDLTIEAHQHTYEIINYQAPTCSSTGINGCFYCEECGKYFDDHMNEVDEDEVIIPKLPHNLVHCEAEEATEYYDGNIEYWYCSDCGSYFSDENCTEEISYDETITYFTYAGKLTHVEAIPATCTSEGNIEYWYYYNGNYYKYFSDENGNEQIYSSDITTEKTAHTYNSEGICEVCGFEEGSSVGLAYTLSDDETYYTVSGIGTCTDTEIVIPSKYNGVAVTAIESDAFKQNTSITSVTIPDSVTSIGRSAFNGCTSLTSVTMGSGVTSIENSAFFDCTALESITIPDGVTSIGDNAFYYCTSLESLTIGESVTSIGGDAFGGCTALTEINFNATAILNSYSGIFDNAGKNGDGITVNIGANVTQIPAYLFYCTSSDVPKITSVVFAESSKCESIGDYSFSRTALTSINIPDDVTYIGSGVFSRCTSLTSITIPENVTSIGESAFYGCSSLTSITIPDGVTSISDYAFYNCSSLTNITIPESVTSIGEEAFCGCSLLTSITIPERVTSIGEYAFSGCTALTEINFNATAMEDLSSNNYAFYNAGQSGDGITVTIGESVTKIPAYLFYTGWSGSYAPKITSVVFAEDSVCESIGTYAFCGCAALTSLTIGKSLITISDYAFNSCTALTEINFNATAMEDLTPSNSSSSNYVFTYAGQSGDGITVNIGANVTKIPAYLFCPRYNTSSYYAPKITSVVFAEGSVCESIGTYAFYYCAELTSITIPNSVTHLGCAAYTHTGYYDDSNNWTDDALCIGNFLVIVNNVTTFTVPSSVTHIADWAFNYCNSLTSLTIGSNVISIGDCAFINCSSLSSITMNSSNYFKLEDGALYTKDGKELLYYLKSDNETFTILSGVTTIRGGAFQNAYSLTSIIIPDSVTTIGDYAFYYCSKLTSITIPNSVTSIGREAFFYCTATIVWGDNPSITEISGYTFDYYKGTGLTIPDSVTTIDDYAFYGCYYLTSITIPDGVTSIGNYAFAGTVLTSIIIPDSVTSIGDYAFYYCTSLTSVTIGSGVTSIGDYAFRNCTSLTSITIPDGVTSIGYSAFYECTSLTNLTIGSGVISIGDSAFYGCTALTEINFNAIAMEDLSPTNRTSSSGNMVFAKAGQSGDGITVTIGANVTKIPAYLFYPTYYSEGYSPKITSIVFAEGSVCESIGDSAFQDCTTLTSVYYNGTASQWASISFGSSSSNPLYYADNLYLNGTLATDITLEGITSINAYAFYNCTSLTSVTIGSGVTSIGDYAFYYCTSITSVTIGSGVTSIGDYAFRNCTSLTSITIPDSVTSIDSDAFYNCTSLTSVTIGSGVTSIGYVAFYYCTSLESITIGSSVTSIGDYAFGCCYHLVEIYNLSSLEISAGSSNYGYVGYYAKNVYTTESSSNNFISQDNYTFYNNNGTYYLVGYTGSDTELTLPALTVNGSTVSYIINKYAFCDNTKITSITIPNSVTSIGYEAFYYCTSLTSVYYAGTADEWNNISMNGSTGNPSNSSNPTYYGATLYYFSESEPTESGNYWHYVNGVATVWGSETSGETYVGNTYVVDFTTLTYYENDVESESLKEQYADQYAAATVMTITFTDSETATYVFDSSSIEGGSKYSLTGNYTLEEGTFVFSNCAWSDGSTAEDTEGMTFMFGDATEFINGAMVSFGYDGTDVTFWISFGGSGNTDEDGNTVDVVLYTAAGTIAVATDDTTAE